MFKGKLFWLLIVALVLVLVPQVASAQQAGSGTLALSGVSSGKANAGLEFTTDLTVSVDTTGPGLTGLEVYLGFASASVEAVDISNATPGVQPAEVFTDFFESGPTPAANEVITAAGIVAPNISMPGRTCPGAKYPCVHLSMAGYKPQTQKTGVIARLHWKGLAAGSTAFAILNPVNGAPYPAAPRTALSDSDGYLIPITSATTTNIEVISYGHIIGVVQRQGVPPSVPDTGTLGCTRLDATLTVNDPQRSAFSLSNSTPVTASQPITTPGGFWLTVKGGTSGYAVRATYPGYLPAQKTGINVPNGDVTIGTTKLYGGDVNGDNAINILDIVTIIANLGTTSLPVRSSTQSCGPIQGTEGDSSLQAPVDSAFDINDDGVVDISDLSITAGNFGKTGPTPWGQ